MVRITIKGGTWKNTEDEILKAAVMKYGMNQWSRISSLLVRKSAKQCKARWYEWLDPSIRKTEWSREEEEKLLHLAKIMPCQWRSIAPMMGRTAAQCLEHYEHLLDAAQQPEEAAAAAAASSSSAGVGGAAASASSSGGARSLLKDDPRRLRPGEIDPLPEAKPARPDPVDMDEDEKEMLSEARARLANTKGKKAKRKAREKQLEEARRLTVLQRQRELRAAGIEMKPSKKRKVGIDYMEEIPLEKKVPAGFYSVAEEDSETLARKQAVGFRTQNLQDLEGKSRVQAEQEERKKDAKRLKLFKETNLPEALLKINALNDPAQISRRMNMDLPAPMVSEQELREIAKATGGNLVQALAGGATPMHTAGNATPAVGSHIPARTPLRPDTILRESQNLLSLTKANSSLLGGANTPLIDSDFSGVKPRSSAVATPNVLATPGHPMNGGATPRHTVPGTPMRDGLGINEQGGALTAAQAIAASKARVSGRSKPSKLASALSALPAPQNQFALVLPDLPKPVDNSVPMEEDAEDALARVQATASESKAAAWRMESQVIQRGLPRPPIVNSVYEEDGQDAIAMEIEKELIQLIRYDAAKHPLDGGKKVKSSKLPVLAPFSEAEIKSARQLVDDELSNLYGKLTPAEFGILFDHLNLSSTWSQLSGDSIFLPHKKAFGSKAETERESKDLLIAAYQQQFELTKQSFQAQSKKSSKLEQNLSILVGGHMQINAKLRQECQQLSNQLVDTLRNKNCFEMLAGLESIAIPSRRAELQALFRVQQEKEKELQKKFQLLSQQLADSNSK